MIDAASVGSILLVWLALATCGLLAWPLAGLLLPDDLDRGYLAAKPLGWLIGSYAAWLASVAGVPFWRFGWIVGLGALVVVFGIANRRPRTLPPVARILQWETGFLAILLVGAVIKAGVPDIHGLEKFMDFGFVNAALRTTTMPPPDPWWAGAPINYYYFGHVAAAWLIQLAGVPSDHGFNVMIAVLFAFAATLSYRIVEGCLHPGSPRIALVCGCAAASLVTLGGNFHSVLYGPFRQFSWTTYARDFYYPDSTRFVGFDPPTGDKGFTEMPAYGFAVGDLHAHLLNLPTAFLLVLILVRLVQREAAPRPTGGVRPVEAIILALLFAVAAMCNSWDAISYGILMGLAGLILILRPGSGQVGRLVRLSSWGFFVIVAAFVLAAPFLLDFKPIASHLKWSDAHTPLWQLAVLYGHVAVPCALLLAAMLTRMRRDPRWLAGAMLAALAAVLVALPEIAYVKDIYGEDHRRANTMFKLSFEAQPVAVMASLILIGLILQSVRTAVALVGLVLSVPLLATLSYGGIMHGGLFRSLGSRTLTLDGLGFVDRTHAEDRPLVDWLRDQPPTRHILMVEAPGDSFGDAGRLSAMSGVPSLLGWRGHEWLWRGNISPVYARSDQIKAFYLSRSLRQACDFVEAESVTHVAIGTIEHQSFSGLDLSVLEQLGPAIVRSGASLLIEVDLKNCQQ